MLDIAPGTSTADLLEQVARGNLDCALVESTRYTLARRFFPALGGAVVVQERRGLPTIAPDGRLMVCESERVRGLVVASACTVGGIHHSPGVGRLVAEIVSGQQAWLPPSALSVDRFGEEYASDPSLRARCEEVYAHHYHEVY